jgi:chemotaxis protein MotB
MGSSEKVKKAVAGYFNDPKGTGSLLGTTMTGTGEAIKEASTDDLQKLKDKLEQEIKARKDLEKLSKQIEITITPEGLRIELLEGKDGTFYEIGSAKLSSSGQELLALLASELKTLPNSLLIEGHTDSTPYSNDGSYSNWDLSADRANSARRLMQADGVRTDQVTQVRGYADQMLRVKSNPTDPSNRRVSILVKNDNEAVPTVSAALRQAHKKERRVSLRRRARQKWARRPAARLPRQFLLPRRHRHRPSQRRELLRRSLGCCRD